MNTTEVTEMTVSIHQDLVDTIVYLEENNNIKNLLHPQIKLIIFEGHWMGEIYPSLIKFPLGETILTHSFSAKDLEELLIKMKAYSSKQLKNTKNGMIDTINF